MLVHYVTDEPAKIPAIRAMLEPQFYILPHLLGEGSAEINPNGVVVVDADLRNAVCVEQTKIVLQELSCIQERLFVVPNNVVSMVAQAYALGATAVVSQPREIMSKLAQIEAPAKEAKSDSALPDTANSAAAFNSMFEAIRSGRSIRVTEAEYATSQIIDGIAQAGLTAWVDNVRRHHVGTFQHCLLVTGVAVGFAIDIGFASLDIKRLGMAATLHDVGKAHIPLSILDKPGRLDRSEEQIIRSHPVIGYELLKNIPGISMETLDGVRHHHEYLDGSGYPDGLTAPQISDLVRLLTISDIFAALIESRPYRPAMPRQDAYKILCEMDGKLERSLVKAFRNVALAA